MGELGDDRVGIQEVPFQPFRLPVVRAFFGQVRPNAAAHAVQFVAAAAAVGLEKPAAFCQFRHAGDVTFLVAASTRGAYVSFDKQRLRPESHRPCAFVLSVASPCPPWQMVQPNFGIGWGPTFG